MPLSLPRVHDSAGLSAFTILDPKSALVPDGTIVLSFDDGPNPDAEVSERLLDVLEKHGVKATFCFIGANIQRSPATATRALRSGHDIAMHTYTHLPGTLLSARRLEDEIYATVRTIREVTRFSDFVPRLFRPPWGIVTPPVRRVVRKLNLMITPLSFFVREAHVSSRQSPRYVEAIKRGIVDRRGGAFVMHEMRFVPSGRDICEKRWLPDAVDDLIIWAKERGFTFGMYEQFPGRVSQLPSQAPQRAL